MDIHLEKRNVQKCKNLSFYLSANVKANINTNTN